MEAQRGASSASSSGTARPKAPKRPANEAQKKGDLQEAAPLRF